MPRPRQRHQLRVIAGSARGRRLAVPPGFDIRPTKERVREAVFSALDARGVLVDATVLDLYAGTGALAIEALSRGAASAVLVDRDATATATIEQNLATTGFDRVARVERRAVEAALAREPLEAPFDLVCCDPPYELDAHAVGAALAPLATGAWLAPDAIVVVERGRDADADALAAHLTGLTVTWNRTFGDTLVLFLQR
jgi:16S rRNA (guanine966-N2)-methyltransferase